MYNVNKDSVMKTIEVDGKKIELYDSIEDLPILRFHKFNKMLLVDAGVGSDLADFDRHIERAIIYASGDTPKMAVKELQNLRQNVYLIQSEVSPRCMAFAALVKSIDGVEYNDMSDDGLQKVINIIGNVSHNEMTGYLNSVKKKIDDDLRLYFPSLFEDATLKEYYDRLKDRTVKVLKTVIAGKATDEESKEISDITSELITYFRPQEYDGSEGVEVKQDRQFENMCLVLSQNLHVDAKKFTVLEYYNAFEYVKEQNKKAMRQAKAK
jgi:hypothetical protein